MKSVAVSAGAAKFVAGGGRDVVAEAGFEPGEELQLVDPRGEELGLALADPDNERLRVMATPADGFARIDGALVGVRVEHALALRRKLGIADAGRAYRIIHGAGDGLPGLACDVLGDIAVVYAYGEGLRAIGRRLADAVVGFARLRGAVIKLRTRGGAAAEIVQDVVGDVAERGFATEAEPAGFTPAGGVAAEASYEIHALGGLNTGLFTDMREHRAALVRLAGGARVLNLFSYTGSLGLACARGGAVAVANVDTSDGVHAWSRANFERNRAAGTWHTGDALRFLARAGRDGERYDLVIVDPPMASPARGGKGWLAGRDYPELIASAAAVVPSGGLLWLAANGSDAASLAKLARDGLRGRTTSVIATGGLPPEYPTLLAQPGDRYLQVLVLRL